VRLDHLLSKESNLPKADLILSEPNNATIRSIIGEAKDLKTCLRANLHKVLSDLYLSQDGYKEG